MGDVEKWLVFEGKASRSLLTPRIFETELVGSTLGLHSDVHLSYVELRSPLAHLITTDLSVLELRQLISGTCSLMHF